MKGLNDKDLIVRNCLGSFEEGIERERFVIDPISDKTLRLVHLFSGTPMGPRYTLADGETMESVAAEFSERLGTKVVLPMHWKEGLEVNAGSAPEGSRP